MSEIIGRALEQSILTKLCSSKQPEFVAVYGRRRVGKTFLIREYFIKRQKKKKVIFFYVTGAKDGALHDQIANFTKSLGEAFYSGARLEARDNWNDALQALTDAIKNSTNKECVLFFDEFPWLVTKNSRLLQTLEYYWNHYWSGDPRIKLIICGSSAGWILKNIINNKGGLYNRVTHSIHLKPFNLKETDEYLRSRNIKFTHEQIVHVYMILGGIPFYLSQIEQGLSAIQSIERLAFKDNGFLLKEFNNLYATLFDEAQTYIALARLISEHHYGIGQEEIAKSLPNISSGGRLVEWLNNLENAGFITRLKPFGNKKKGIYYKLIDEYSLFYFRWIEPIKDSLLEQGMRPGYWENVQSSPSWSSWTGYAFESLCYKHIAQIAKGLGLPPTAIPYVWRYAPGKNSSEAGAQIDLLFDRQDDAITICEIKYTKSPFVIDKQYATQLNQKLKVFQHVIKTNKQLLLAIISSSGLKNNMYSEELVSGTIDIKHLFASPE